MSTLALSVWPLGAFVLAALGSWQGCQKTRRAAAPAQTLTLPAEAVRQLEPRLVPVVLREVNSSIRTTGRIEVPDTQLAHVVAPVGGLVVSLDAALGARVERGSLLARIDSPDLAQAQGALTRAAADLTQADKAKQRTQKLAALGAVPQRDLESAEDAWESAAAEKARAAEVLTLLGRRGSSAAMGQQDSTLYRLVSPIAGEVLFVAQAMGTQLQSQYGGGSSVELFVIANMATMWAVADVHEADVGRVHIGQTAQVLGVPGQQAPLQAPIEWVSRTLNPKTRFGRARLTLANPDGLLRPDMFVQLRIRAPGEVQPTVAREAVVTLGDKTLVYLRQAMAPDGSWQLVRRPVIVDATAEGEALPVSHGLAVGEQVVGHAAQQLGAYLR